jgi:microcystin-dependent protein
MASGTVWGSFTGKATNIARPYVNWSETTDIASNTSTITATLFFVRYDGYNSFNNYGPSFGLSIDGQQATESHNFSMGPNGATATVMSITRTVTHNPGGDKKITISAWGDTGISIGSVSLSGEVTLDTIPRASTFTISGNTIGSEITIDINRASSGFTHNISYSLPEGTWRAGWNGVATQQKFTPAMGDCNYITNGGSGTAKIIVDTWNGGTFIGTTSQTFTLNVPASVVPTASALSIAIAGTGRDKTLGKYIQSLSKVVSSFTAAGVYGSTITGTSITIRRQSDRADTQVISGTSGTTANPVSVSGVYEVIAEVWDSRGRYNNVWGSFTVDAYSPPSITKFTAARGNPTTDVLATIIASWNNLGTDNPASITVKGKNNVGTETTVYTLTNSTAGTVNTAPTFTSQSDASSFVYTLTVTDSFGNEATATVTIGTSFVEMSISKGKGIGVGKVWEQGALDVAGEIYQNGDKIIPAGVMNMFAGATAPTGYLLCQGQAISRTTYADLFTAIGTTYGTGDGSTTFNLPNMQGRVPVGLWSADPSFNALGAWGGEKTHTLTTAEMPSHSHTAPTWDGTTNGTYEVPSGQYGVDFPNGAQTSNTGGGQAHNNLQPYMTLNFIIKV